MFLPSLDGGHLFIFFCLVITARITVISTYPSRGDPCCAKPVTNNRPAQIQETLRAFCTHFCAVCQQKIAGAALCPRSAGVVRCVIEIAAWGTTSNGIPTTHFF